MTVNEALVQRATRTHNSPKAAQTHEPKGNPVTPTSDPEANITTLLRLAGKTDLPKIDDLQSALLEESELVRQAIYLLTSTSDQPAHLNFGQLFPDDAIDAYRDGENHPLPGADPKICGLQTHMIEIPYDDPTCNAASRRDFVEHLLIPLARERVAEVLRGIFPPDLFARLTPYHRALLSELNHRLTDTKLSHCICAAPAFPVDTESAIANVIQGTPVFNGSPCFAGQMPSDPIAPPYFI